MTIDPPDLFGLAPSEEGPAGVAGHGAVVQVGGCRGAADTVAAGQSLLLLLRPPACPLLVRPHPPQSIIKKNLIRREVHKED